ARSTFRTDCQSPRIRDTAVQKPWVRDRQGPGKGFGMADTQDSAAPGERVVIKKYANRRLYNTASSSYVTLEHLSEMVKQNIDFVVYDAKTNEDITRSVLTQIIFEEESQQGQSLLRIQFTNLGHTPGATVFDEQVRQNLALFDRAMKMFSPFAYAKPDEPPPAPAPKAEAAS